MFVNISPAPFNMRAAKRQGETPPAPVGPSVGPFGMTFTFSVRFCLLWSQWQGIAKDVPLFLL